MLPSLRHFFRFVDLDETFIAHGFYKKVLHSLESGRWSIATHNLTTLFAQIGAAFVLNNKAPACESTNISRTNRYPELS